MTAHPSANDRRNSDFRARLGEAGVSPLWDVMAKLVTESPQPQEVSVSWSYETVRPLLLEAGAVVSAEQAERRVLILENPGLPGGRRATNSLYAGLQLVLPGEIAPVHRHSQSALRFILESAGAYTAVDGERVEMRPFDLILTPNMRWHEHGNETSEPAIWLDGLDIPTVLHFNSGFAEREPHQDAPIAFVPPGDSTKRYGSNLKPKPGTTADRNIRNHPLFHYPYAQWREALEDTANHSEPDPHFGCRMEFLNPYTAGSVLPTISAFVQRMPAGEKTRRVWSTDGAIWVCVEGTGRMRVGDKTYELGLRDVVIAPSWQPVSFEAASDLVMFAYSDQTAQQKLELWQERRE